MPPRPRVLFLCVHNSARSQMAEGILCALAGDRYEVFSAGSEPTQVHPLARLVLEEKGIETTFMRSKSVREFLDQAFDHVITLCAEEVCPVFPGAAKRQHWALADPAAVVGTADEQLAAFRETATELTRRLEAWLADAEGLTDGNPA